MANEKIHRNDQAAGRSDGNEPGTWPGSATTVDGPVETSTSGILGDAQPGPDRGSASTSAKTQEPDDRPADDPPADTRWG